MISDVLSLERLLRVKSKVELRLPGLLLDSPLVCVPLNQAGGCRSLLRVNYADDGVQVATVLAAHEISGGNERITGLLEVDSVSAANATAGDSESITGLLEVDTGSAAIAGDSERVTGLLEVDTVSATVATAGDSERVPWILEVPQLAEIGGAAESAAHATADDSEGIIGLRVSQSSFCMPINLSNSSGCVDVDACARLPAVPGVSASASSSAFPPASLAVVAHARSTPMHGAHNPWSDTVRNSGSHGKEEFQRGEFRFGRRIASCLRGGGRGKFSAGRQCTEAGCRFTSRTATRHR